MQCARAILWEAVIGYPTLQRETLAMQTEEATQYTPRFQSPEAKQATADPKLQKHKIAGKISRFGSCNTGTPSLLTRTTAPNACALYYTRTTAPNACALEVSEPRVIILS